MEKLLTFEPFRRLDGSSEFEEFLASLPIKDRAKLLAVIDDTEVHGLTVAISQQWVKKLRDGIFELRSRHGSAIQRALYF
jgi:phage-related protein